MEFHQVYKKSFFFIPIQKKSGEVDSQDDKLQNLCQQSSVDKFPPQKNICFFQINEKKKKKNDSHVGDMTFRIVDGIPLRTFVNPTRW